VKLNERIFKFRRKNIIDGKGMEKQEEEINWNSY